MKTRNFVLLMLIAFTANACTAYFREPGWQSVVVKTPSPQTPEPPEISVSFETSEGTFMSVDVSPDDTTIVFDLLGDLYLMSVEGGQATPLTSGRHWDRAPIFSKAGDEVYFISDREGHDNLWRVSLSDGTIKQITNFESHVEGFPNVSPSGEVIVGTGFGERGLETVLRSIDIADGTGHWIGAPADAWFDYDSFSRNRPRQVRYSGVQSPNGSVYFDEAPFDRDLERQVVKLYRYDFQSSEIVALTPTDAAYADYGPQISHNGHILSFFRQHSDRSTELWLRDLKSGTERKVADLGETDDASIGAFQATRPNYSFSPGDDFLFLSHNGKIIRIDVENGEITDIPFRATVEREVAQRAQAAPRQIDLVTARPDVIRWPSFAPDFDEVIYYAAMGFLWREDIGGGGGQRLTDSDELVYMPALSPDGMAIAYIGFDERKAEYGAGKLRILDLESGRIQDLLSAPETNFLFPRWSPDGTKIAAIRESRTSDGLVAHYGWTDVDDSRFNAVAEAPSSEDYLAIQVFSRFVGFDESDERLLFSYRASQDETRLIAADLASGSQTTLAVGLEGVWGIVPSPDLAHLAFIRSDESVWIMPFEGADETQRFAADDPAVRRVGSLGGYYLDWITNDDLSFSYGRTVYRYSLAEGQLSSFKPNASIVREGVTRTVVYRGARIVTVASTDDVPQIIESGTVITENGRISAVGPEEETAIPAGSIVIDVSDHTIIPGLIDSHYHRIGGSGGVIGISGLKLPRCHFVDESALGYGVTSAWEPGGPANDGVPWVADLQAAGRIPGPRWTHSASGGVGYPWSRLSSYEAALKAVRRHRALGVHVLKEYNTPTRQQQRWLADAARAEDMGIVAHIQSFDAMMTRIIDGYTGGDHSYIPVPFYRDVAELMRQTGFVWTPNIDISAGSLGATATLSYFWNEVLLSNPKAGQKLESLVTSYSFLPERLQLRQFDIPLATHRISRVARQAARAAGDEINVAMSGHGMPGAKLHGEMWYFWRGGAPALEVIRAATMINAEKLGLQNEIGSLEASKIADFLILDDNPLEDILNTLSIEYTVQGGVIYDADTAERVDPSKLPACEAHKVEHDVCLATANWAQDQLIDPREHRCGMVFKRVNFSSITFGP